MAQGLIFRKNKSISTPFWDGRHKPPLELSADPYKISAHYWGRASKALASARRSSGRVGVRERELP